MGRQKLGGTTVLALEAWLGVEAIRLRDEGMPAIARKAAAPAPESPRELLRDEPDRELLARAESEREETGDFQAELAKAVEARFGKDEG